MKITISHDHASFRITKKSGIKIAVRSLKDIRANLVVTNGEVISSTNNDDEFQEELSRIKKLALEMHDELKDMPLFK